MFVRLIGMLILVVLSADLVAKTPKEVFRSGESQVHLVELFSTESCSSCPPADKWMSALQQHPDVWKKFVPVVYHVDYWDYLGWKDPYSKKEFTERQRSYSRLWRINRIYTPGFVLDGREWKRRSRVELLAKTDKVGQLEVSHQGSGEFSVSFQPRKAVKGTFVLNASLQGNGIDVRVLRGENSGKTLEHNFLTLEFKAGVPLARKGQRYHGKLRFKGSKDKRVSHKSVAFWVSRANSLTPIQAVGGRVPSLDKAK